MKAAEKISTITTMDLYGGSACLDFINSMLNEELPVERLHNYQDLLILARRLELLDKPTFSTLTRAAKKDPQEAVRVYEKALALRKSMLGVFQSIARGRFKQMPGMQLKTFNKFIQEALAQRQFVISGDQLQRTWVFPAESMTQPVWLFSLSAYNLLTTSDQAMIKECGACAWLFIDETKNHRRKWCDMKTCGTNEKARRYYARNKKA